MIFRRNLDQLWILMIWLFSNSNFTPLIYQIGKEADFNFFGLNSFSFLLCKFTDNRVSSQMFPCAMSLFKKDIILLCFMINEDDT